MSMGLNWMCFQWESSLDLNPLSVPCGVQAIDGIPKNRRNLTPQTDRLDPPVIFEIEKN